MSPYSRLSSTAYPRPLDPAAKLFPDSFFLSCLCPWPGENIPLCHIFKPDTKNYDRINPGRLRDTSLSISRKGKSSSSSHPWKEPVGSRKASRTPGQLAEGWPHTEEHPGPPGKSWKEARGWGQARHSQAGHFLVAPPSLSTPWWPGLWQCPDFCHRGYTTSRNAPEKDPGCSDTNTRSTGHPAPSMDEQKLSPRRKRRQGHKLCTYGDRGHAWNGQGMGKVKTTVALHGANSISPNCS